MRVPNSVRDLDEHAVSIWLKSEPVAVERDESDVHQVIKSRVQVARGNATESLLKLAFLAAAIRAMGERVDDSTLKAIHARGEQTRAQRPKLASVSYDDG